MRLELHQQHITAMLKVLRVAHALMIHDLRTFCTQVATLYEPILVDT